MRYINTILTANNPQEMAETTLKISVPIVCQPLFVKRIAIGLGVSILRTYIVLITIITTANAPAFRRYVAYTPRLVLVVILGST